MPGLNTVYICHVTSYSLLEIERFLMLFDMTFLNCKTMIRLTFSILRYIIIQIMHS